MWSAERIGRPLLHGLRRSAGRPLPRVRGGARLVGRDAEFAALEAAPAGAREGDAQVVGLVGEAGAGKICDELARRAAEAGVTVRRTAGVSHARAVPLLPVLGLMRDCFALSDGDSPADVRARVAARLLGLDPAFEADLPLVFDFLEVPDPDRPVPPLGPDARRRRVLEVLRRTTQRRSERESLLLILEDPHWFDPHTMRWPWRWPRPAPTATTSSPP